VQSFAVHLREYDVMDRSTFRKFEKLIPNSVELTRPKIRTSTAESIVSALNADQKKIVSSILPGNNHRFVSTAVMVSELIDILEQVSTDGEESENCAKLLECVKNSLSAVVDVLFSSAAYNVKTQKIATFKAAGISDPDSNKSTDFFSEADLQDFTRKMERERTLNSLKRDGHPLHQGGVLKRRRYGPPQNFGRGHGFGFGSRPFRSSGYGGIGRRDRGF